MSIVRSVLLGLARSESLRRLAIGFGPARAMSRRFVAGETLDQAVRVVQTLNEQGLRVTLDHLGENVTTETEARDSTNEILDLVAAIEEQGLQSGLSVKLTQLGLDLGPWLAAENLQRIVARAAMADSFVRIDMESHEYVEATLDILAGLWDQYRNVGAVIQSYLFRSPDDLARLVEMGASVRLVKGAYDEPPEVAYPDKADTDAAFVQLMEMLFSPKARANGVYPAIATHDTRLIDWAKEHAGQQGIDRDRFEFQMLYGIRSGMQRQLVAKGYRVRTYVPYGEQWWPYFMRRLAERPANILFFVRNLVHR